MKELSIEEKAKRYDEIIKVAKKWHTDAQIGFKRSLEILFPEIKENEDERIRNGLIGYFRAGKCENISSYHGISTNDILAWLEKQGEQKPDDKVEPKFHEGEWVMLDRPVLITKVEDMPYNTHRYWTSDGTWFGDATKAKLWTIEDAKDGDMLACESGWTCIFKELNHNSFGEILFDSYCFIDRTGWFCDGAKGHTLDKRINGNIYPATKEQRDQLEKAIADAGYAFDKKELKKTDQKPKENHLISLKDFQEAFELKAKQYDINLPNRGYDIHAMCKELYSLLIKQKPTWNEEDESNLDSAIYYIRREPYRENDVEPIVDWLRTLKDRVQPKQE